jgi:hypothetical protein
MRKTGLDLLTQRARVVPGKVTADWNSGVATSGQPGADLFTIGSVGQWFRLTEAYLILTGFNAAATVTVRYYFIIAGEERCLGEDEWEVAVDGEVAYLLWFWEVEIYGPMRIEVHSDQAADDGFAATYEYKIKDW